MVTRTESDIIGTVAIPEDALYGIHAARARQNFPDDHSFPVEWYKSVGLVKQACYLAYGSFKKAAKEKQATEAYTFSFMDDEILSNLVETAAEVAGGKYFDQFIVPAISGGAGTSINMNINEIVANATLLKLGKRPGDYDIVDPVEHANVFQSTNDVIPTALRVALMFLFRDLEDSINRARGAAEQKEAEHREDLRIGYTQMQEAVPTSFGKLFSTYCEAFSRDWWRVSKCQERIKLINLGGGAIGTGIAIPRFIIMEATGILQSITGLPLARSENLPDATSNLDPFVEVHAILKSHAVTLEKMVSDIRLLASDISGQKEIIIPGKQTGSSIMPGKINPVIPEFIVSAAHRVYANDQLITSLCAQGCLELNAYLPVIGISMIESLKLMTAAGRTLEENLIRDMKVNAGVSMEKLLRSPSITTALIPAVGYNSASDLAKTMKEKNLSIIEANKEKNIMKEDQLLQLLSPQNLLKLGFTLSDQKG
jgi:aspartate ammonia-lyase